MAIFGNRTPSPFSALDTQDAPPGVFDAIMAAQQPAKKFGGFFSDDTDSQGRGKGQRLQLALSGLADLADGLSGKQGNAFDGAQQQQAQQIALANKKKIQQELSTAVDPTTGQIDMAKARLIIAKHGDFDQLMKMQAEPTEYDATPRTVLDPKTGKPILIQTSKTGATSTLPFGAVDTDLLSPEALAQKQGIAKAGASNVTMNAGPSFSSGVGTGAAEILTTQRTQAQSARDAIIQGNEILAALDSGKVVAGPGTTFGMAARQLFGGDQEKLNATRSVIKGLAEITLQSRGLLKGQGQITENEQKTLEKARSGDIDSLSPNEIRVIVKANERLGRAQMGTYKSTLDRASKTGVTPDVLAMYGMDDAPVYTPPVRRPSGPVTIKNDLDYDNLPSGTEFIGPDNVKRRKP